MVEINLSKRALYIFLAVQIIIAIIGITYAFGGTTPNVMGHSASEIAGGTFPDSLYKFPQKVQIGNAINDLGAALHIKGSTANGWPSSFIFLQAPAGNDTGIRFYSDNIANFANTKVHMYYDADNLTFKIEGVPVYINNILVNAQTYPAGGTGGTGTGGTTCTPEWDCSSWNPDPCIGQPDQYRTCTDNQNCGVITGKPAEERSCCENNYKDQTGLGLYQQGELAKNCGGNVCGYCEVTGTTATSFGGVNIITAHADDLEGNAYYRMTGNDACNFYYPKLNYNDPFRCVRCEGGQEWGLTDCGSSYKFGSIYPGTTYAKCYCN